MNLEHEMIKAVKAGNADRVRELIDEDIFLADAKGDDGTSALLTAIYHGHEEIAEIILDSAPTLTIHEAAAADVRDRLTELLAENRARASEYSHDGWTPLHLAVYFNNTDIAELLIAGGAEVDAVSENGMRVTPLHSALSNRNVRVARRLIEQGADVNRRSAAGYAPLHYAAAGGLKEMLHLLLARGADPNARTEDGKTPRDIAVEKDQQEMALLLDSYAESASNGQEL